MFCFPKDYQATCLFTNSDDLRKAMYEMSNISCNLTHLNSSKFSISPFKYSLKIFASPMFTYNVLLLFNFKCFLPFLCRDLSKFQRCHFVLLQTKQCDVNILWATTLILKNFKGQLLQLYKNLSSYGIQFMF